MEASVFGIAGGLAIVFGYVLYFRDLIRGAVVPNAASWLLWSCSTATFLAINLGLGTPAPMLVVPALSAGASLAVAAVALSGGRGVRIERQDVPILWATLALLAAYLALVGFAGGRPSGRGGSALLALASLAALTAFLPILRSTWALPERERAAAWIVWSFGYALMLLAASAAGLGWAHQGWPLVKLAFNLTLACLAASRLRA